MKRLVTSLSAICLLLSCVKDEGEPTHEGKTVSDWIRALEDKDEETREIAASALGSIGPGDKAAVPALIQALKDRDKDVRRAAARALRKFGPAAKAGVPALIEMLKDEDRRVR